MALVELCMAVYNGVHYLPQQLDSLLGQDFEDWQLVVQDDGSTDGSWELLCGYQRRFPEKIILRRNDPGSGSASRNFFSLLQASRAAYVMTCDQDDVWLPDKISVTLQAMRALEAQCGENTPLLVHTDLRVVDAALQTVSPSMMQAQTLDPERDKLQWLLIQNIVTGCTMMANRPLLELLPAQYPDGMAMHDWWLALTAAAFGRIGFVEKQTILYRQHGGNAVGAKRVRSLSYVLHKLTHLPEVREAFNATYRQAEDFLSIYRERLSVPQQALLEEYCSIPTRGKFERWRIVCRLDCLKSGVLRRLANLLFI